MAVNLEELIHNLEELDGRGLSSEQVKVIKASLHVAQQAIGKGPFICGYSGKHDEFTMPDRLQVCPEYGAAGYYTYKMEKGYDEPGW